MNIFLAMVFVFFVQQSLAEKETEFRVENGTAAKLKQFPYQVAMKTTERVGRNMRGRQYSTFCGGTIIGSRKALTAAHCFFKRERTFLDMCCGRQQSLIKPLSMIFVVGGTLNNVGRYRSDNPDGKEQWRRPRMVIPHAQFKFPNHDIAVLFIRHPFILTEYVNVIPYAKKYIDYEGLKCVVSGFGKNSLKKKSEILLWAQIDVISNEYCSLMESQNMEKFVCTLSLLSDVSKGDSGGPLICYKTGHKNEGEDGILVGVTCGKGPHISVFTRVSSYKSLVEISRAATCESSFILCVSTVHLVNKLLSRLFC